jgi:hypothetical protein
LAFPLLLTDIKLNKTTYITKTDHTLSKSYEHMVGESTNKVNKCIKFCSNYIICTTTRVSCESKASWLKRAIMYVARWTKVRASVSLSTSTYNEKPIPTTMYIINVMKQLAYFYTVKKRFFLASWLGRNFFLREISFSVRNADSPIMGVTDIGRVSILVLLLVLQITSNFHRTLSFCY